MKAKSFSIVILMLIGVLVFIGCKKDDPQPSTSSNTNTGTDTPGYVSILVSFTEEKGMCNYAWNVVIGLGYSSTDVANEAYFQSNRSINSPAGISASLDPGIYYYKAKKTYNLSTCGGTDQPSTSKSGSFTITSEETTNISFWL